jgi:hypothetical protein
LFVIHCSLIKMKASKKICLLAALFLTGSVALAQVVAYGTTGSCTWTLTGTSGNYTLTVSGTGRMANYAYAVIGGTAPWSSYDSGIKTAIIEQGVTNVGNYAFQDCVELTSATIPYSVTSIGEGAFQDCPKLSSITFPVPASLTSIGNGAFVWCRSLTSITLPASLTSIGSQAFQECYTLASITIPALVTSIGYMAFNYCVDLKSITNLSLRPQSISQATAWFIGPHGPGGVTLTVPTSSVERYKTATVWKDFQKPINGGGILLSVAANNAALGRVTGTPPSGLYPKNTAVSLTATPVTGYGVFWTSGGANLGNAATLSFSLTRDTVITANFAPTSGTTGACTWRLTGPYDNLTLTIEGNGAMGDYTYNNMPWYGYRTYIKAVVIGTGVTSIGNYAFAECSGVTSITIPASVTSIGTEVFYNALKLNSLTNLSLTPQIIDPHLFDPYGLRDITLTVPTSSVNRYQSAAVWKDLKKLITGGGILLSVAANNAALGRVTRTPPSGLYPKNTAVSLTATPVTGYGFFGWTSGGANLGNATTLSFSLTRDTVITANFAQTSGTIGACSWTLNNDTLTIEGTGTLNKGTWGNNIKVVVIKDGVTSIGGWAFYECRGLTSVTIPASVTSIGESAFCYCYGLTSVTIPASVTSIGNAAFSYCYGLTSVTFPESLTSISTGAFYGCSGLTSINVDAANTIYSSENSVVFNKDKTTLILCPGGKTGSYTIPASVTSIGQWAFGYCYGLTSVTFPESLTSIGDKAFRECRGLSSVTFNESLSSNGDHAFRYCYGLTSVTFPASLTSIG